MKRNDIRPWIFNGLLLAIVAMMLIALATTSRWEWHHYVVCIVLAGFLALLGNLDRIESLKAGPAGLEAKTREVVQRAESTLTELQNLGEVMASTLFRLLDTSNRWSGFSQAERDKVKDQLIEALHAIGVPEKNRQAIRNLEAPWVVVDLVNAAAEGLPKGPQANNEWSAYWAQWHKGLTRPSPNELREVLRRFGGDEAWRESLIQDLEYYLATGTQRRPSLWAERDQWVKWTRDGTWPT